MRSNLVVAVKPTVVAAALASAPAHAQDFGLYASSAVNSGDAAWLFGATLAGIAAIVGVSAFYVRPTSPATTSFSALLIAAATILWAVFGYSLALSGPASFLGDTSNLFLANLAEVVSGTGVPESAVTLFELVLALVAVSIVAASLSGAPAAPRPLAFALLWFAVAYLPICHWIRGGGWLGALGALDFGGGVVVHVSAGVAGLAIALMFGSRSKQTDGEGPASQDRVSLGACILLLAGTVALTGGAAFGSGDAAAMALLNASFGMAAGAIVWGGIDRLRHGAPRPEEIAHGAIAGAVAISATGSYVGTAGALVTGMAAGLASYGAYLALRRRGLAATSASIFALHAVGGATGAMMLGIFAFPALGGPGFETAVTPANQIAAQAIAVVVVTIWSGIVALGLSSMLSIGRRTSTRAAA